MRILLLAKKNPWPPHDGEAIAIGRIASGLAHAGNAVRVLYMNTPKHHFNASEIPADFSGNVQYESVWVDAGVSISAAFFNLFKKTPYHAERFYSKQFENRILEILKNERPDVVQAEGLYLLKYQSITEKFFPVKWVYRSHNIEADIWKQVATREKNLLKKIYLSIQSRKLSKFERKMALQADAIIPISIADANIYSNVWKAKCVKYLPTGITISNQTADVSGTGLYFIGGLDWIPNQEGVIWFLEKIFPVVRAVHKDIIFHLAGRNAPEIFKKMTIPGLQFYGEVNDASAFAADKAICVVPLLSGGGMKIKIAEAMANGNYVVTTPVGAAGMPEGIEKHISVANNATEFANTIIRLINDPRTTSRQAIEGRDFVFNNLDNDKLCLDLTQFYKTL